MEVKDAGIVVFVAEAGGIEGVSVGTDCGPAGVFAFVGCSMSKLPQAVGGGDATAPAGGEPITLGDFAGLLTKSPKSSKSSSAGAPLVVDGCCAGGLASCARLGAME